MPSQKTSEHLQSQLISWVKAYKTTAFIPNDPIQFPHRYKQDPTACEVVGFLVALISHGQRQKILETSELLLALMGGDPVGFIRNYHTKKDIKVLQPFVYRFNRGADIGWLCQIVQWVLHQYGSLENAFIASIPQDACYSENDLTQQQRLGYFVSHLLQIAPPIPKGREGGCRFLLPNPTLGGACKRLNMFLRWMVRTDAQEPLEARVDFGLWQQALKPADLMMPIDTHVARLSQQFGITSRTTHNWAMAEEITEYFRRISPEDPTRFDFALFGAGVSKQKSPSVATFR
jgi:uncharacterized protein (TIGR02757 family)